MPIDPFFSVLAALAATYLIHSTLVLSLVAIAFGLWRTPSHTLRSWLWMAALLLPVLSTTGAALRGNSGWVLNWSDESTPSSHESTAASTSPGAADTSAVMLRIPVPILDDPVRPGSSNSLASDLPRLLEPGFPPSGDIPDSPTPAPQVVATPTTPERVEEPWVIEITPTTETELQPESLPVDSARSAPRSKFSNHLSAHTTMTPAVRHRQGSADRYAILGVVLSLAMLSGMCLYIARMLAARRWLLFAVPVAEGPARRLLDRMLNQSGLARPVRLLAHPRCAEPAACGIWRPIIVLPSNLEQQLSKDELRALLTHELAHHARRDPLWLALGQLTAHLGWWQPLNWLALRLWRRSVESLCDQWTLTRGVSAITLARCLTNIAEWRLSGAVTPGLTAGGASLSLRIEQLLTTDAAADPWQSPLRRRVSLLGLLLLFGLFARIGPAVHRGGTQEARARPETDAAANADSPSRASATPMATPDPGMPPSATIATAPPDASRDFAAVAADLDRALTLLQAIESDPEITAAAARLRSRLRSLGSRLAADHDDHTQLPPETSTSIPPD